MKSSSRIASQKPPDREDLSDTFKSELEAMYAARMDSVSEIFVTFRHVVPTETVNANPDVVYVQIDAGGVQGRIVIDNLVSSAPQRPASRAEKIERLPPRAQETSTII